jgi:hypothetical protein
MIPAQVSMSSALIMNTPVYIGLPVETLRISIHIPAQPATHFAGANIVSGQSNHEDRLQFKRTQHIYPLKLAALNQSPGA